MVKLLLAIVLGSMLMVTSFVLNERSPLSAQTGGLTLQIGERAQLVDKLYLNVSLTITCPPFESDISGQASVQVQQASGQTIARAFGAITQPLICDNSPHVYNVTANNDGSVPFHGGRASVRAQAGACGVVGGVFQCIFGEVGPQTLRISGGG